MSESCSIQLPVAVVMVRPASFGFNPETAATNLFQKENVDLSRREIQSRARREFDLMFGRLKAAGVEIFLVEDREYPAAPDAVFPNNWISFHRDGTVVLYPMFAPSRRVERRRDIIETVRSNGYDVTRVIDLTHHESHGRYLEGTGSLVFDHLERCVYANISPRTHPVVMKELCDQLGYSPIPFRAVDASGREIYHTNVMMSIGTGFAVICSESIPDAVERKLVIDRLSASRREVIDIDFNQLEHFAANILELCTKSGASVVAMSTKACLAFRPDQRAVIEKYARILESPIPLIEEIEGGSVRCMLAGIHLPHGN